MNKLEVELPDENSLGGKSGAHYYSWDWRAQPDWDKINESIKGLCRHGELPIFYELNTQTDQYAVLICGKPNMDFKEIELLCHLMGHKVYERELAV